MKIALVHDQLNEFGGAERVLLTMSEMYPDAPIYTAYYKKGSPAWERFKNRDIRVSWAHYIPLFSTKLHSPLRFLAPFIWNSFDFTEYDVILGSSSWYITKGFKKKQRVNDKKQGRQIEICYCHTPPRWLYGYPTSVNWQKRYPIVRAYATIVGFFMRQYDFHAAQRVNYFIANSKETVRRIKKFYRRDSTVIYPPIDIESKIENRKLKIEKKDYYLIVSRLAQAKNIDVVIYACNQLNVPLKIVGRGVEELFLRSISGPTVEFVGYVSDNELRTLYEGAKAFLALATDEDFGMTPVESMSVGTPVIGFNGGGYTESIIDNKTGILFNEPTVESLMNAIKLFESIHKDWSKDCIVQAKKFSKERFKQELRKFIAESAV
jgi:glycosyltransferase involved in cell wall biosynthesis